MRKIAEKDNLQRGCVPQAGEYERVAVCAAEIIGLLATGPRSATRSSLTPGSGSACA